MSNTFEGSAGNVVQFRDVNGDFHVRQSEDNSVGAWFEGERGKIALDRDNSLYLVIANRGTAARRFSLAVEGLPATVVTVVPDDEIAFEGRGTVRRLLVLRCADTEPMAGPVTLKAVLTDADTGEIRTFGDHETITIPPRPLVSAALVPPERVSSAGRYPMVVRVANVGNTELGVWLGVHDEPEDDPACLGTGHVHFRADRFDLRLGEVIDVPVKVDVPEQGWADRDRRVLLAVRVDDQDGPGEPVRGTGFTQHGLQSELARHATGFTRRFGEWSGQAQVRRQGWLAGSALVLLAVGVLAGQLTGASPDTRDAAPPSPPGPAAEVAVAAPTPSEAPSTRMPCELGTSVVMLKPLTGDEALAHGAWLVEVESARLAKRATAVPALRDHRVRASRREDVCAATLTALGAAPRFTSFVWIGPAPTAEAAALCANLDKPNTHDCLPLPTT